MEDRIFREEQSHLAETYDRILEIKKELEAYLSDLKSEASDYKETVSEDLSLDLIGHEEATETHIELENANAYIDQLNQKNDAAAERLSRADRLLPAPYFARITVQFDPDEDPEDFYIGSAAMRDDKTQEHLVIDWRTPIAELYYNQENGRTSYEVDGRTIPADLLLRRQFDVNGRKLKAYFDTSVAIEDPMLVRSLSERKTDTMKAITATIQKEQNAIIRCREVPALLVSGIAGSGKTSVLLQRIAYLFYRQRKNLRPQDICLLTLNPVFASYIENVLPDMGEENPDTMTWKEFLDEAGVPSGLSGAPDRPEELEKIDRLLPDLRLRKNDFRPVYHGSQEVLGVSDIARAASFREKLGCGPRFVQVFTRDLLDMAEAAVKRFDREERRRMEDWGLEEKDMEEAREGKKGGNASQFIERYGFLNIEHIAVRLLGRKPTRTEWLYLWTALTGECRRRVRYVMIDEVQDYTKAQLMLLRKYYPAANFLMLGDEFQAVRAGTISFAGIHDLFRSYGQKVEEMPLLTSYRSSPEVTEIFTGLLPAEKKIQISSVQHPGEVPSISAFAEQENYLDALEEAVEAALRDAEKDGGLTAVICANKKSLEHVSWILGRRMGKKVPPVITAEKRLPKKGVFLMELELAKGLEFDRVILPDADPDRYPEDLISRHRLYTAVSRAIRKLCIFAEGELTPLLADYRKGSAGGPSGV